jgi:hypothetical protein
MPKPPRHTAKQIKPHAIVLNADASTSKVKRVAGTGDEDRDDDNAPREFWVELVAGVKTTVKRITATFRPPDPPRYIPSEVWPDPPRGGTGTLRYGEQNDTPISRAVAGSDATFQLGHAESQEPIPQPPLPKTKGVVGAGARMALDRKTQLQLRLQARFATLDSIGITCQEIKGETGTALRVYLIFTPHAEQHDAWAEQQVLQTDIEASDYEQRTNAELVEQAYQAFLPLVQAHFPGWHPPGYAASSDDVSFVTL